MSPLSHRASSLTITPFQVMEVLEHAKKLEQQGRKIIHMEVGEPDFDTPKCIIDCAVDALKSGKTRYSSSLGIEPLRQAIADKYNTEYGVSVSPDQIIITSGSSAALMLLFSLSLDSGDEVLLTDPSYACYSNFLELYGAVPKYVPLKKENQFRLYPDDLKDKITNKTKAIILCSPSNPTGQLVPDELWNFLAEKDILIFSDEIYHNLVYEKQPRTAIEFSKNAFVISGFSKAYAMTGWRLGYIIAPPEWMRLLQKGHQNFFIAANTFVQWAGVAALSQAGKDIAEMKDMFAKRRDLLLEELKSIGIDPGYTPDGAFYLIVDFSQVFEDSLKLAFKILNETGIALAPGIDFGNQTKSYLRFSYATSFDNIKEAVKRLDCYLKSC